jgi:hypothetical protein
MGDSKNLQNEGSVTPPILSARDQVFVQLVRQTSTIQDIAFINPDAFNRAYFEKSGKVDPADIAVMRQMIDAQLPGRSSFFDDRRIANRIAESLTNPPFARRYEFGDAEGAPGTPTTAFAMISLQGSRADHRDEFMPLVANRDADSLAPIPGEDVYWDGFWGIHEGTHPNQPLLPTFESRIEQDTNIMNRELESDLAGISWLRAKGQEEMVQLLIDFRALSAAGDPGHAALAVLGDEPGQVATTEHYTAARDHADVMNRVLLNDLGISESNLGNMRKFHEREYAGHIQRLLDSGAFDNADPNPYVREFIAAYAGAVERRIVEASPALNAETSPSPPGGDKDKIDVGAIKGGAPVVTLHDGDQATLTIGGVSAVNFFAANADPVLAEQRIALAQEHQTGLGQDFKRTTGAPALA